MKTSPATDRARQLGAALALSIIAFGTSVTEAGVALQWIDQFGSDASDVARGVSADGLGNVYVSGYTFGDLGGPHSGGILDAFVGKYDAAGNQLWMRQLGSGASDTSTSISADGRGSVYIAGSTQGDLAGPNAGLADAFVSRFDDAGQLIWSRQLGSSATDSAFGVSADRIGSVYVTGYTIGDLAGPHSGGTWDPWLSRYDEDGTHLWTRQIGTGTADVSRAVSADRLGNVYIAGFTGGGTDAPRTANAFLSRYDDTGELLWTQELGTGGLNESWAVAADDFGNVYVAGRTTESLAGPNAGSLDAFLAKYDDTGQLLWGRQLGTDRIDEARGIAVDALGHVYITGYIDGRLGPPARGDAFVSLFDAAGNHRWTHQFGTSVLDEAWGVSTDGLGQAYVVGRTLGSLAGPNAGHSDAFIAKIPEPGTAALFTLTFITLLSRHGRSLMRHAQRR